MCLEEKPFPYPQVQKRSPAEFVRPLSQEEEAYETTQAESNFLSIVSAILMGCFRIPQTNSYNKNGDWR